MEKRLIYTDDKLMDAVLADLPRFKPNLMALKEKHKSLERGELTSHEFESLKKEPIESIRKRYLDQFVKKIEKNGIKSFILIEQHKKFYEGIVYDFLRDVKRLRSFNPSPMSRMVRLHLNQITYDDDKKSFDLKEDMIEEIFEKHCAKYAEGDNEIRAYEILEEISELATEFKAITDKLGYRNYREFGQFLGHFMTEPNGDGQIVPNSEGLFGMFASVKRMKKFSNRPVRS